MSRKAVALLACLAVVSALSGCGVSKRALDGAEKRIAVLKSKGVPNSLLSRPIVFLYQARSAKERGDADLARMSADSMLYLIAAAEASYGEKAQSLKSIVDSLRGIINEGRKELSGLQLRELDSITARADSFASINWVLQTEETMRAAAAALPHLKFCEARATELRPRIPGVWT